MNNKILAVLIIIIIGVAGLAIGLFFILQSGPTEPDSPVELAWSQIWGGSSVEDVSGLYLDDLFNVYLVGTTTTISEDFCFLKYNALGALQGNTTWDGGGSDVISSIANHTPVNYYITRWQSMPIIYGYGPLYNNSLLKFNSSGGITWEVSDLNMDGAKSDANGNVWLFHRWNYTIYIAKFNETGDLQWNSTWNSVYRPVKIMTAIDSTGNVFLAGEVDMGAEFDIYLAKFNESGVFQWNVTWGGSNQDAFYHMVIDPLGNIYLSAITFGVNELSIIKYNNSGIWQWDYTWTAENTNDEIHGISFDSSNDVYVTGQVGSPASSNIMLRKISSLGVLQWNHTWGGSARDSEPSIALGPGDDIYLAGKTESFGVGLTDIFLLKYNSTGDFKGQYIWGGPGIETLSFILVDSADNIYLTGQTQSFGAGITDIFLLKLTQKP